MYAIEAALLQSVTSLCSIKGPILLKIRLETNVFVNSVHQLPGPVRCVLGWAPCGEKSRFVKSCQQRSVSWQREKNFLAVLQQSFSNRRRQISTAPVKQWLWRPAPHTLRFGPRLLGINKSRQPPFSMNKGDMRSFLSEQTQRTAVTLFTRPFAGVLAPRTSTCPLAVLPAVGVMVGNQGRLGESAGA